ncbi:UNVERIFIED_ORG: hypothetical protein GGI57_005285 [Rhizobium aethiopicum]|uniref:DUF1353 domain-containing protein n=1 Tax=Rhizobium phaseoli TaxID=396 RepID=UPI001485A97E|nr:DUF1353 domain-containing protein [Rhizobium phaseoli]
MRVRMWLAAFLLLSVAPASAEFVGTLEFQPTGCEATGKCALKYDFGYIDPSRMGWQAKAGLVTDGASIPSWAQMIIGGAWDKQFIRAAVIHDWYCLRTVRPRRMTHRMFYDALIESGVHRAKALTMYYAVLVGSHMWINLVEGKPCKGMNNCVQNVGGSLSIPSAIIERNESGELVAYRSPRFSDPEIEKDITEAGAIIEGGSIDNPDAVEELARGRHPDDFFLNNGDAITYQGPSSKYPVQ